MPGANLSSSLDSLATTTRLNRLHHGQRGVVVTVHEARLAARLAARGLVPGAEFDVLRGGDPMLVRVDESRWALAGDEAAEIEVECAAGRLRVIRSWLHKLLS